jgi:hypothetical protein
METTLLGLLAFAALAIWFLAAREAAEHAREHARRLCRRHGVQLLDQTVALERVRLARTASGLRLRRRYGFEFSPDGILRESGKVLMLGTELEGASLPLSDLPVPGGPLT